MIVCVLDDLLFSVKISTAAKALGAEVYFERTPGTVVEHIKERQPSLVIFDLNSLKMQPLHVIAEMKADPQTRGIRTLGFVSHVQAETIAAARQAGVDEVLARSAFTDQLGEILTRQPGPKGSGLS
jgi:CheY-like chemotaxis protein